MFIKDCWIIVLEQRREINQPLSYMILHVIDVIKKKKKKVFLFFVQMLTFRNLSLIKRSTAKRATQKCRFPSLASPFLSLLDKHTKNKRTDEVLGGWLWRLVIKEDLWDLGSSFVRARGLCSKDAPFMHPGPQKKIPSETSWPETHLTSLRVRLQLWFPAKMIAFLENNVKRPTAFVGNLKECSKSSWGI